MNMPNETNSFDENEFEEKPRRSKKFYIAMIICLAAVSAAAWSTYKSVKNFVVPSKNESQTQTVPKTTAKEIHESIGENSVKGTQKEIQKAKKFIPFDSSEDTAKKADAPSKESENLQAVSANPSDMLILYPAGNNVIKEFSDGKPEYSSTLGDWRCHDGVDFKADTGSLVKSITDGTIKDIYSDPSYGTTVVIEHDSKFTAYYCGLGETVLIQKGSRVKSGQEIGSIGKVPSEIADEPHLHLAIYKGDKFIDPLLILEKDNQ